MVMVRVGSREKTEYEKIYSKIRGISFLTLAKELALRRLSNFKMDYRRL